MYPSIDLLFPDIERKWVLLSLSLSSVDPESYQVDNLNAKCTIAPSPSFNPRKTSTSLPPSPTLRFLPGCLLLPVPLSPK